MSNVLADGGCDMNVRVADRMMGIQDTVDGLLVCAKACLWLRVFVAEMASCWIDESMKDARKMIVAEPRGDNR